MRILHLLFFLFSFVLSINAQEFKEVLRMNLPNQTYGYVNSVSIDKTYAIIGTPGQEPDYSNNNPINNCKGAAYVFEKNTFDEWKMVQQLTPANRVFGEMFGGFVVIKGNYAAVSGDGIYVFQRNALGLWQEQLHLKSTTEKMYKSIAICDSTIFTGITQHNTDREGKDSTTEALTIAERNVLGAWEEKQTLTGVGRYVAVSNNYMIAGSLKSVYIHEKAPDGTWIKKQLLKSITEGLILGVSLSNTNAIINVNANVFVFERDAVGNWIEKQQLKPLNQAIFISNASSAAIDGSTIIIGASSEPKEHSDFKPYDWPSAGAAYIFMRGETNEWVQTQRIVENPVTGFTNFGACVDVSEGSVIISTVNAGADPGFIFEKEYIITNSFATTLSGYSIQVFPNPAEGTINIQSEGGFINACIKLISSTGIVLMETQHISGSHYNLTISEQAAGLFFIEVTQNHQTSRMRFIKM